MPRTRTILALVAALLVAALLLPFAVNVNRYRLRIAGELEARLGRPVRVGGVRLRLLGWPGFELRNVVIGEDPAFGIEPFVRVSTVRATLRLRSLWNGRLGFSSLVFVEPSVNLARNREGRWNIESIIQAGQQRQPQGVAGNGASAAAPAKTVGPTNARPQAWFPGYPLPYIELQDARINFKSGDTKSVFFFSGVDAALYEDSQRVNLRFTGAPARTDRTITDIGQLRVEGSFPAGGGGPGKGMRLNVSLRDAHLAELLSLTAWSDQSVYGRVQLDAEVFDDAGAVRAAGTALVSELHRWDMNPPQDKTALELRFDSVVDLPAGAVQVRSLRAPLGAGMLEGTGNITDLLRHPAARFHLSFSGARAGSVLAAIGHFSSRVNPAARLDGTLDGELDVQALPLRIQGFIAGRNLEFRAPGLSSAMLREARVTLDGSSARLERAALDLPGDRRLVLGAIWDWDLRRGKLIASGEDLPLPVLAALSSAVGGPVPPPSIASLPESHVSLDVESELNRGMGPRVTGWARVARLRWTPPGVPSTVLVHTARLDFTPDQVRATRLVASWAGGTVTGAARIPLHQPAAYWADLHVNELNGAALGAALRGRSRGPMAATTPAALIEAGPPANTERDRGSFRADGRLSIGRLLLGRVELTGLQAAFRLGSRRLELDRARAGFDGGEWEGAGKVDFGGAAPAVEVHGRVRGFSLARAAAMAPAFGGLAEGSGDATLTLAASGWEMPELLANLSMKVRLQARDLLLKNVDLQAAAAGETSAGGMSHVSSCTALLSVERRRVRLERVTLQTVAGTAFVAEGTVAFDRTADIRVRPAESAANRAAVLSAFRLVGPLDSPHTLAAQK